MKKSKLAAKSKIKKVSKNKKSISSLLNKALSKAMKKPMKALRVKMAAKPKKPQVKIAAKPANKTAPKNIKSKSLPAKAPKSGVMNTKASSVKTASAKTSVKPIDKKSLLKAPVEPVTKKGGKPTPAMPVVAAVLTKATKAAKPVKAAKLSKEGGSSERMCRELACENMATTKGYCRLDYIKNWKKIKRKEMILKEGKLNQYIEELVGKYPDKYIDVIRQDLSTEVNFNKVIHDLELDESIDDLDYDGDSIDALIGGIKKEIEDFGDEEF